MQKDRYDNVKKILIIRLSSIGDIVLTSEFVRIARQKFLNARIDFLLQDKFKELLKYNPNIDNLIAYNKSQNSKLIIEERDRYLEENELKNYDIIFDLQNNLRTKVWTNGIASKIFRLKKWRSTKLKLVYLKKLELQVPPIPENYLNVGSDFNFVSDGNGLELFLENEQDYNYKIKKENNIIGVAPGAHHFTKRYPAVKYSELIGKTNKKNPEIKFKLFGSKEDSESAKIIIENNPDSEIEDFTGKLSLLETAKEIDKCGRFITNDTGLMHIAAARKVPLLAIFGSTVTNFGFSPYGIPYKIVETEEKLSCRPCSHIGKSKCPKGHFKCMENIEPELIIKNLQNLET